VKEGNGEGERGNEPATSAFGAALSLLLLFYQNISTHLDRENEERHLKETEDEVMEETIWRKRKW